MVSVRAVCAEVRRQATDVCFVLSAPTTVDDTSLTVSLYQMKALMLPITLSFNKEAYSSFSCWSGKTVVTLSTPILRECEVQSRLNHAGNRRELPRAAASFLAASKRSFPPSISTRTAMSFVLHSMRSESVMFCVLNSLRGLSRATASFFVVSRSSLTGQVGRASLQVWATV